MAMEMRQSLKLSQQLVMTPQLQQAIKLLQLSRVELVELVREEMLENPVLEDDLELGSTNPEKEVVEASQSTAADPPVAEAPAPGEGQEAQPEGEVAAADNAPNEIDWENYLDSYQAGSSPGAGVRPNDDDLPSLEQTLTKTESLEEHLMWQLRMSDLTEEQKQIGELIVGNIDRDGYVKDPPIEDLAAEAECSLEEAEVVLMKIQSFDPVGVGARSLAECMFIQAVHYGEDDDLLVKMIRSHIGNLEKKNYQAIARDLKEPLEEIYEAVKVFQEFDPRPGRQYSSDDPHYITPDVYIHKVGDKYFVVPNDDGLPKLKISNFYRSAMDGSANAKNYIQDKLRSAQWLIRSIHQRQRTIIKVTESILKFQREFFDKGVAHLKPLILRDVAEDIGMHESTISRVTTSKYLHTPQGIYELKYFFNSGISRTNGDDLASQAVKSKIKNIIAGEDPKKPLSDQKIVMQLKEGNIDIARRTVAKYREQLGILSSSKRKQVF